MCFITFDLWISYDRTENTVMCNSVNRWLFEKQLTFTLDFGFG